MTVAAAAAAWLGGSILLLSDRRRGLAVGIGIMAAGLAGLAAGGGHPVEAATLLSGGVVAGALRLRTGPSGWGMMPDGSTPRLILAIVTGLVATWTAATLTTGDGTGLRFALIVLLALLALRLLLGAEATAANTAASAMALTLGAASLLPQSGAAEVACIVAALVAAVLPALPRPETHGA